MLFTREVKTMLKTIDLGGGREITLSNEISWLMEYRDQFNQDIVPVIMPILLGVIQTIGNLADDIEDLNAIKASDVFRLMRSDELVEIGVKLATFESMDVLHVMWAMAKAYDPKIKEPKQWIRDLGGPNHEEVPLVDVIIPAIGELVVRGSMKPKNWERLTANMKTIKGALQPKTKKTKKK